MIVAKSILTALLFAIGISSVFAQKTYNVSVYSKMFRSREHSRWFDFSDMPAGPGKYVAFDYGEVDKPRICGMFVINDSGRLLTKTKYGCCFEDLNFTDENRWGQARGCPDSNVYILNKIITYGYKKAELDTLLLLAFAKNQNFKHLLKTIQLHAHNLQPYEFIFHEISLGYTDLPCNLDYQIVLKNNDTFRITHIAARLYIPKDTTIGSFSTMYSYKINGRQHKGYQFILIKPGLEEDYLKYLMNEK